MAITLDGTNGITTPDVESSGPISGTNGTFTGNVGITGPNLGTTVGSQSLAQKITINNGNLDYCEITNTRQVAGSAWNGAGTRIQEKIDATYMAYIQFNGVVDGGISFGTGLNASPTGISERLRIDSTGAFGINGANYGTSGQVLTSGGSGAAPSWTSRAMASTVMTAKSRATGTSYQNTTSGWLFVAFASVNNGASATVGATAPGNSVTACTSNANGTGGSFMVPPGWYYIMNVNTMSFVSEGQA